MRIVWYATVVERFADPGDLRHRFHGDYDTAGEWVTPGKALEAVGMAVWNYLETASEGHVADEFALELTLRFEKEPR